MRYLACHEKALRGTFDFPIELYQVNRQHPRYEMPFHWHMECEFIRIIKGSFLLSIDGEAMTLEAGETAFIPGGSIHGGAPSECEYDCVVFDMERFLHDSTVCRERFTATVGDSSRIFRRFSSGSPTGNAVWQLFDALCARRAGYEFIVTGMLWQFTGTVLEHRLYSVPDGEEQRVSKRTVQIKNALRRIRSDYSSPLSLDELASEADMSPQYFCRVFRRVTGRSPVDYLNFYRIECAAERILTTDDSITSIALSCGFSDLSYFTKLFRRYKGISASDYRKAAPSEANVQQTKLCALTFDDGPNTTTTVHMLDVLERHGVLASFFLCGDNITPQTEPVMRRAVEMGCELGNHSRSHPPFSDLSPEQMLAEIEYTSQAILAATGRAPEFFRPPYIAVNDEVFGTVPLPMICGIGAKDWLEEITASQRHDMIMEQIRPGAIILLHDGEGNEQTVEAADTLIPALLAEGYEFVTVSELFRRYGIDPRAKKYLYTYADQDYRMPAWE